MLRYAAVLVIAYFFVGCSSADKAQVRQDLHSMSADVQAAVAKCAGDPACQKAVIDAANLAIEKAK